MNLDLMPKVDLHCHLIGTVRGSTFAELARREGLDLPDSADDPAWAHGLIE